MKNWKVTETIRTQVYEGNPSNNETEHQWNWRVFKKLTKKHFLWHKNTVLPGKTMKNCPTLLQTILKEVTYSSIF